MNSNTDGETINSLPVELYTPTPNDESALPAPQLPPKKKTKGVANPKTAQAQAAQAVARTSQRDKKRNLTELLRICMGFKESNGARGGKVNWWKSVATKYSHDVEQISHTTAASRVENAIRQRKEYPDEMTGEEEEDTQYTLALRQWMQVYEEEKEVAAEKAAAARRLNEESEEAARVRANLCEPKRKKKRPQVAEELDDDDGMDSDGQQEADDLLLDRQALNLQATVSTGGRSTPVGSERSKRRRGADQSKNEEATELEGQMSKYLAILTAKELNRGKSALPAVMERKEKLEEGIQRIGKVEEGLEQSGAKLSSIESLLQRLIDK